MNELLLLDVALAIIAAVAIFYARPVITNAWARPRRARSWPS
jgi:hypothetical protein